MAGFCDEIKVVFNKDNSVSVEDNGRGIPVDIHKEEKKPALEVVMTVLHAGGKFDKGSYKVSGGLHGVGVSVVNALSSWLEAEIKRDGKKYHQRYEKGDTVSKLKTIGESKSTGSRVTFLPDPEIFNAVEWDYEIIAERLRELAYLNKKLKIAFLDNREGKNGEEKIFRYKGGLSDYVKFLDSSNSAIHEKVITVIKEDNDVPVDVALRYNDGFNENILTFVNNINTIEGGTHLSGFRSALTLSLIHI